jgi:hypothetical protein
MCPPLWDRSYRHIRGAYKIKLKNINKYKVAIVSRVFISDDFLVYLLFEPDAFVAAVQLPPEGNSELVNADVLADPFPDLLEALQSLESTSQHLLHTPEEEVGLRSQIQQIGGVPKQLDLVCGNHIEQCRLWGPEIFAPVKGPFLGQPMVFSENVALCPIGHPHRQR